MAAVSGLSSASGAGVRGWTVRMRKVPTASCAPLPRRCDGKTTSRRHDGGNQRCAHRPAKANLLAVDCESQSKSL